MGGDIIFRKRSGHVKKRYCEDALSEIVSSLSLIVVLVIATGIILSYSTGQYPKTTLPHTEIEYTNSSGYAFFTHSGGDNLSPDSIRIRVFNGTFKKEYDQHTIHLIRPDGNATNWSTSGSDLGFGYSLRVPASGTNLSYQILLNKSGGEHLYREFGKPGATTILPIPTTPTPTPYPDVNCTLTESDALFSITHTGSNPPTYLLSSLGNGTHSYTILGQGFSKTMNGRDASITFPNLTTDRTYQVIHTVIQKDSYYPVCSKSSSQSVTVYGCSDTCYANFIYESDPYNRFNISFRDRSEGADEWRWNFGDGHTKSESNPIHEYSSLTIPSYRVTLTIGKNQCGNRIYCSTTKQVSINCSANADFNWIYEGRSPDTWDVNFLWNAGTYLFGKPYVLIWDFGDGNRTQISHLDWTGSIQHGYSHYNQCKDYSATLTVNTKDCGSYSATKTVSLPCICYENPIANFSVAKEQIGTPFVISITDNSTHSKSSTGLVQWIWDMGDGVVFNNTSPPGTFTYSYPRCGEYSILLTVFDTQGCWDDTIRKATCGGDICIPGIPNASFVYVPTGKTVKYTDTSKPEGTIQRWQWDMGDGTRYITQNVTHEYATYGNYTVKLRVWDQDGCFGDTIRDISLTCPQPDANFTITNVIANPRTFRFTDTSIIPTGLAANYLWDFGDGTSYSGKNPPDKEYATCGQHPVRLKVMTDCGSWDEVVKPAVCGCPLPEARFRIEPTTDPQEFRFINESVSEHPITGLFWEFGDGTNSTEQTPTHRYATCGHFTIRLKVTTDCGSSDDVIQDAICGCPAPEAQFRIETTADPLEFRFINESLSTRPITGLFWEFGDGTNSTEENPTHRYSTCSHFTVRLKVTTDCGSIDDVIQDAICGCPLPEARFRIEPTTDPQEFRFINESVSERPITAVLWEFGDGTNSTEQTPTHRYAACGQFTVRLKVTTDCGSSDDVIQDAICGCPPPKPDFDYTCTGPTNVSFTDLSRAIGGGINAWYWEFGDLRPDNTSGLQNPNHKYDNPGTYPVNLTVFTTCNSSARWTRFVTVPCCEMPVPGFTYACNPDGLTVDFSDTTKTSGDDISDWLWEFGDGNSSILQNPQHTYIRNGTWQVNLSVTTTCGAKNSYRESISTPCFCTPPVANFSTEIISGEPFTVRIRDSSQKPETITHWNWSFGDGTYYTGQNPPDHTYAAGCGEYLVSLTVTNECGARDTFDKLVCCPVYANFTYRMEPVNGTAPLTVYFTDRTIGTPQSWGWTFGDGGVSSFRNPVYTYKTGGNYSATLHATSPCGGNETHSEQIHVYCPPVEALFNYTIVNEDPLTVQFTDLSTGYDIVEWNWYFGDGSSSKEQHPVHTYYIRDDYQVILTIKNSCGSESTNSMYLPIGCLPLTIVATAHEGGFINPSGNVTVPCEWSQQFNITPDLCHTIRDVVIDENQPNALHLGPVESYTFINVQYDQTIDAYFDLKQFQIASSADAGGTIDPLGITVVDCGSDQSYTITAAFCFNITDVIINGTQHLGPQVSPFTYTFTNVTSDQSIHAVFALKTFPINATAGFGGNITPNGIVMVNCGYDQSFSITNLTCWNISDVRVDGTSMGPIRSYTFTNVTEPHNISASFVPRGPYNITASAVYLDVGSYTPIPITGMIDPEGVTSVQCGNSQSYSMEPSFIIGKETYLFAELLIDGRFSSAINPYVFTNVQEDHTIVAYYGPKCYFLKGVVRNETTGLPIENIRIEFYRNATPNEFLWYTYTASDGSYIIPNVIANAAQRYDAYIGNNSPPWQTIRSYLYDDPNPDFNGPWRWRIQFNPGSKCDRYLDWYGTF
ncbi:PKD [Methanospirillum hungatei JF-1]|uniref:PKD n=1 Tax=Methanospirillum hungatei JF-1 (strain ATCC 27890 / DSM 864 / NBRC 100397 / JF-1) TaxID=323259 RepID=Q2FTX1_METHJ|nr:PKD domain-containing protein [Methanospirillum hungatei]ABD42127.1 PKD [Methanospirillum hungatei JF-1]